MKGNFAPVVGECVVDDLVVDGVLPRGLDGVYLRNGPNPAHEPLLGARRYHWFDGDGMVHWIRLSPGGSGNLENKASYGRKYVRTRGFEQEERQGAALYTGLRDINPIWDVLIPRLVKKSVRVAQPRLAVLGDPIQKHRQQRRQVPRRPVTRDVRVRQRVRARTGTGLTNERTVRL